MVTVRPCSSVEELRDALNVISRYFGFENDLESAERFAQWMEPERAHAARDGELVVGAAGAFSFRLSVPGGSVPAAGVTVVGVSPTHRRRGIMTELMRVQLDDCKARGEPAAWLWASEGTIYGRFGYGLASRVGSMSLARERTAFAEAFEPRGTVRLVDPAEALRLFPPLHEQVFRQRPGMFARSTTWWETRTLAPGVTDKTPKNLAVLDLDGAPAGYAVFKVKQEWGRSGYSTGAVEIIEVMTPTPEAARELWRWLLDFDWTSQLKADLLPLDHPLFLLLAEPRRLNVQLGDGVWVRLVDVEAALSARSFAPGEPVVLEVADRFLPENAGRWRVGDADAGRTEAEPELALDVSGLGSVYLGGFSFTELVQASRARELVPGAAARADALFRTEVGPWCPEIF